jgi:hypothetical protein
MSELWRYLRSLGQMPHKNRQLPTESPLGYDLRNPDDRAEVEEMTSKSSMEELKNTFEKLEDGLFWKHGESYEVYDPKEFISDTWNWITTNFIPREEVEGLRMKFRSYADESIEINKQIGHNQAVEKLNAKIDKLIGGTK